MRAKNGSPFGVFKIASAYIGTVVGAGFASGQEVLRFFAAHGILGLVSIVVSVLLFFTVGYTVLLLGRNLKAESHVAIVRHTNGNVLGLFIDIVVTVFLFGGLSAMIAGAGAIFEEQFSISPLWGTMLMAAVTFLTVVSGTRGVISAISFVVPFLIVSVLFISISSLLNSPVTAEKLEMASRVGGATPNWLVSAVNYASYNVVIAIGVLTPMGAQTPDKKKLFYGALLGALGLGLGMAAIYFCLIANIAEVGALQVPLVAVAGKLSQIVKNVFAVVLFAEVYTTAVGNLYAFVQRAAYKLPKAGVAAVTALLAFLCGQLGFSNLVRYLYPAVGYGGILFFFGVLYVWIAKRASVR
ncbi:MAG: YkvI family membrane protein [Christensenellales bacterium]